MDKNIRDEAFKELENNDEELVVEVMRGDSDQSHDENSESTDKHAGMASIISKLGQESLSQRISKFYKNHFKGRVLRIFGVIILIAIITILCSNLAINKNFTVTFYQIRSDKVSDNIRIVELADLHNNQFGKNNKQLIDKIKSLHPDLIFYAGDMMNYKNSNYSVLFDLSDKLCEIAPIYACYGNNELDQYLFEDKEFTKNFEKHGVNLLSNEAEEIVVGKTKIQLVAISDDLEQYDVETNNAKKFIENIEPTNACRICLTHYPELFFEKLQNKGIDIAFTGHAHGGLIRLPKIGGVYSTGEGFLPKLTSGVNEMEDGTQVVVSRGLGSSSFFPRINNQPELVVADICWY
ncbi:MAG: metallophosphoesterase family protein [Clostridia bacterium]|nr:metallophosphoesterase family protein [Clostridia bacterium]